MTLDLERSTPHAVPEHPSPEPDDRAPLALAAGLIAAVLGGIVWATIVLVTRFEIGWVAWGVGALVGAGMGRATTQRSTGLAATAAGLAAVGLLVGKLIISLGSAGSLGDELAQHPEYLEGAVAWQLYEDGALTAETLAGIDATFAAGDTLSDALWDDMLLQARAWLGERTDQERSELAHGIAQGYIAQLGIVDGILVQLGLWDLLWFGLALATAFRMMAPAREAEVAV